MSNVTSDILLSKIPTDSPFLPGTAIQFAWDSTSLTTILSCPRRYKYGIIEGWTPKNPDVAVALAFGILMHAGVELYHRERALGHDNDTAIENTLWQLKSYPEFAMLPTNQDIEEARAEQDEEDDGIAFRNSKVRSRYHLFRALVWYFEHYRNDAFEVLHLQDGAPAVEYSFRVPVGQELSDGTELLLSGHFDRVILFNDEPYIVDTKTTKSITRQWKAGFDLSHQMTGYTLGGKLVLPSPAVGVFIEGVCRQVTAVKFDRFPTRRTPGQMEEYRDLLGYVGRMSELYFNHDFYPMNTASCMFCEYKPVCSVDPALRAGYLNSFYERRPPWNPLRNR